MTVTYSLDVASTRFCGFAKLLGRWKGSIYKILWKEFLVFIAGYALISITYRCFLSEDQKRYFERVVIYFEAFVDHIPLSFVLGFYVSLVIGRWWGEFEAIPWPDKTCYLISTYVHGSDERSRMIRRTLGRYLILMQAFTFQAVSTPVKKRFPTTQHFVAAGLMTKEERTIYENLQATYGKWWLPAQWFCALAMRATKERRIKDYILLKGLLQEFLNYRGACGRMFEYDWISVPLVYTQVVTLATYTYSLALMVGRQFLDPAMKYPTHQVDVYIPIFTLLQFFFYVGWLKVAEQIVNPYGEDDDDFELNWCLSRSCQVVYLLVDHFHTKHPKLKRDLYWDEMLPELPQNKITAKNIVNPQIGSAFNLEVNLEDAEFLPMDTYMEEDSDAHMYNSDSVKQGAGIRHRPSLLMSILNSNLGQSLRKRSMPKSDSFRDAQGHRANSVSLEKVNALRGTPSQSRKSSLIKITSPAHSRTPSLTSYPIPTKRRVSHDLQPAETATPTSTSIPEGSGIMAAMAAAMAPVVANFGDCQLDSASGAADSEAGHQRLESYMPPIPEEPSRVASTSSLDSRTPPPTGGQRGDVQALVAEASKVLEELNRVVSTGRHKKDCESKGYESCCSLDSDYSDEEVCSSPDAGGNPASVQIDIPDDVVEKISNVS